MCDFHSVIVDGAGKIYHLPSNSHSSIAAHFQLDSGIEAHWWECEWDGVSTYRPSPVVQNRRESGGHAPTALAIRAAERHYDTLARILSGEVYVDGFPAPFDDVEYSDVRVRYQRIQDENSAVELSAKMAEIVGEFGTPAQLKAVRLLIDELDLDMSELCESEIESAVEIATNDLYTLEQAYDLVSEDMYSQDYLDESIEEARKEEREKREDEIEEARVEGYDQGILDALNNVAKFTAAYLEDGRPSFLA